MKKESIRNLWAMQLFSLTCLICIGCVAVDDEEQYTQDVVQEETLVDTTTHQTEQTVTATPVEEDTTPVEEDTTSEIIEDTATEQSPQFSLELEDISPPGDCIAPQREEYMARFGVTAEDKDLSDANVLAAKEHTILFVFDKSGSMNNSWNEDGGKKWDIAKETMISSVEPFQDYVTAGTLFFPLSDEESSVAAIDSGSQINFSDGATFLNTWQQNMDAYGASGGTPLMTALEVAHNAIGYACETGILEKPFKVILITDGMPDYYTPNRALGFIDTWFEMGINTTVVGMPGTGEASSLLSEISAVGGGEEIFYTNLSTTEEFNGDMLLLVE